MLGTRFHLPASRPLPRRAPALLVLLVAFGLGSTALDASGTASLRPTRAGLLRQSRGAAEEGFTYLQNDSQVHDFVRNGILLPLRSTADLYVHPDVRHAAARPEVKLFLDRLGEQYRAACGERLVVTSLVRPVSRQPWNSDPLSVHPTGMATDLRVSQIASCRRWLERTLLDLERERVLEAAREQRPPHYHVVVFPRAYATYVAGKGGEVPVSPGVAGTMLAALPSALARAAAPGATGASTVAQVSSAAAAASPTRTTASRGRGKQAAAGHASRYKVRSGDSLWTIARRNGVSVASLRKANRLRTARLRPGQVLSIPAR